MLVILGCLPFQTIVVTLNYFLPCSVSQKTDTVDLYQWAYLPSENCFSYSFLMIIPALAAVSIWTLHTVLVICMYIGIQSRIQNFSFNSFFSGSLPHNSSHLSYFIILYLLYSKFLGIFFFCSFSNSLKLILSSLILSFYFLLTYENKISNSL